MVAGSRSRTSDAPATQYRSRCPRGLRGLRGLRKHHSAPARTATYDEFVAWKEREEERLRDEREARQRALDRTDPRTRIRQDVAEAHRGRLLAIIASVVPESSASRAAYELTLARVAQVEHNFWRADRDPRASDVRRKELTRASAQLAASGAVLAPTTVLIPPRSDFDDDGNVWAENTFSGKARRIY